MKLIKCLDIGSLDAQLTFQKPGPYETGGAPDLRRGLI